MKPTDFQFPYETFRPSQLEALEWLSQTNKPVLLCEAPPGVGKSLIGATWGRMIGGEKGYILTRTLSLLRQYEEQLHLPAIRGAENFECEQGHGTCDDGEKVCSFRGYTDCPYSAQRTVGKEAAQAVTSYAYILADPEARHTADYLVCDEGHSLLDTLTDFQAITIPLELHPPGELDKLPTWAELNVPKVSGAEPPVHPPKPWRRWRRTYLSLRRLANLKLTEEPYVLTKNEQSLVLKPVWPTANVLWRKKTLVMSATLFAGGFLADLFGLTPGNWDYIEVPSPFDVGRRPLYLRPIVPLNANSQPSAYDAMADAITWLVQMYPNEKGLLHVSSYRQVRRLAACLPEGLPILYHNGQTKEERTALFTRFRQEPGPRWLLSPSAREGEDFPYDQARVNVIVKIPYPDLGDPVISARQADGKLGKAYYAATTCANLTQAYGRGMRSEDDWCATWVLDSNIYNLLRWSKQYLPQWVLGAIHRV